MTGIIASAPQQPERTRADDAAMPSGREPRPTFLLVAAVASRIRETASRLRSPDHDVEHLADFERIDSVHDPARHCAVVLHAGPQLVHRRNALERLPSLRRRAPARTVAVVLEKGDENGVRHVVREGAIPLLLPLSVADLQAFAYLAIHETPGYRMIHQCLIWVALESRICLRSAPGRVLELAAHGVPHAKIMEELEIGPETLRKHVRSLKSSTGLSSLGDILALIARLFQGQPSDWLPPFHAARCSDPPQPPAVSSMMFDDTPSSVRPKPKKESTKSSRIRERQDEPDGGA